MTDKPDCGLTDCPWPACRCRYVDDKPVYRPPLRVFVIGFLFWFLILATFVVVWNL